MGPPVTLPAGMTDANTPTAPNAIKRSRVPERYLSERTGASPLRNALRRSVGDCPLRPRCTRGWRVLARRISAYSTPQKRGCRARRSADGGLSTRTFISRRIEPAPQYGLAARRGEPMEKADANR